MVALLYSNLMQFLVFIERTSFLSNIDALKTYGIYLESSIVPIQIQGMPPAKRLILMHIFRPAPYSLRYEKPIPGSSVSVSVLSFNV